MSDFCVRAVPLAALWAAMAAHFWPNPNDVTDHLLRILFPSGMILGIAVAELFAYRWMQRERKPWGWDSFTGFGFSTISSFHLLMCSLDEFKEDAYFQNCIVFERFQKEHRVRCIMSVVISVGATLLGIMHISNCQETHCIMILVSTLVFSVALFYNYRAMKWIARSSLILAEADENADSDPAKTTEMTTEMEAGNQTRKLSYHSDA